MVHDFWVLETSVLIILSTAHYSGVVFICTICFSQYSYLLVQYMGEIQVCHGLLWGILCYYLLSCDNKVISVTLQCVMEFLLLITRTCGFISLRMRSLRILVMSMPLFGMCLIYLVWHDLGLVR